MFDVGRNASFSKTISESDVYMFAGITGDFNPIHVDAEKSKDSIFGKRIVHGILVTGFLSTIIGTSMPGEGTIYMEQDIKFVKPVYIGDTITAVVRIAEVLNEEKKILKLDTIIRNQNNDIVCDGYAVVKAP